MEDIYVYYVNLPDGIDEMVAPCLDGYTVYIDARLSALDQRKAYAHALRHIKSHDWEKTDVNQIEWDARK